MKDDEAHDREMLSNSHFAWALCMWGSGHVAHTQGNLLPAAISFYYSAFHSGFALLAIDRTYDRSSMNRMGHTQLANWLERNMPKTAQEQFDLLRHVRETINYLGMGDSASKLRIVRGHPFGFDTGKERIPFVEMINRASTQSREFVQAVLSEFQMRARSIGARAPSGTDEFWVNEYLGEDAFITVLPDANARRDVLTAAYSLIEYPRIRRSCS